MNKFLKIIGKVFVLYLIYVILNMIMYTGFEDPFLRIQVWKSKDELVTTISCPKSYSWQVFEKDSVLTGNKFEDGGRVSSIQKHRYLQLSLLNRTLASFSPYQNSRDTTYSDRFPAGDNIVLAYIFGSSTITKEITPNLLTQIKLTEYEVPLDDFGSVAKCLYDNHTIMEKELTYPTKLNIKIGWVLLLDSSVKNNAPNIYDGVSFNCKDGKIIATIDNRIQYVKPFQWIGVLGVDGVAYQGTPISTDWSKPISTPGEGCINSKGQTIQDFLSSVPQNILVLP